MIDCRRNFERVKIHRVCGCGQCTIHSKKDPEDLSVNF